jgi:predicted HNH restriction endonuclease
MGNYLNDEELMEEIKKVCKDSKSMREAFDKLERNINFNTFNKYAKKIGVFIVYDKSERPKRIDLKDILNNKCSCDSGTLRKKLFKAKLKDEKCEKCGISEWRGMKISLELHHKDGNTRNNNLSNLIILCPNCHAQTDNYRAKRKG